jgi:hypothetical protein
MRTSELPKNVDPKKLNEFIKNSGLRPRNNSLAFVFQCPRCSKPDKLYIRKKDGRFVCWVCRESDNFQGRAEYALSELTGTPIDEIQVALYGGIVESNGEAYLHVELRDFFGEDDEEPEDLNFVPLYPVMFGPDILPIDEPAARRGREYLASRGIDLALAKKYDLHYQPVSLRVIFPIKMHGDTFGWQGRYILPTEHYDEETDEVTVTLKVLGNKGLIRERTLMFADSLQGSQHAVICEGPIDAVKADLCGGAVATMGKAVSAAQIELIRNAGIKKVYLALDNDAAIETMKLCEKLGDLELYLLKTPPGREDLGAATPEEVYREFLRAERVNAGHLLTFLDEGAALRKAFRA